MVVGERVKRSTHETEKKLAGYDLPARDPGVHGQLSALGRQWWSPRLALALRQGEKRREGHAQGLRDAREVVE